MKSEELEAEKQVNGKLVIFILLIWLIGTNIYIYFVNTGIVKNYFIEINASIIIFLVLIYSMKLIGKDFREYFFPKDKNNINNINLNVEKVFSLTTENHQLLKDDLNTLLENEKRQSRELSTVNQLIIEKHEMFFQYHFNKPDRSDTIGEIFNHYINLDNNTLHYIAFHNKEGKLEEEAYHTSLVKEIQRYEKEGSQNSKEEQLKAYQKFALNYDKLINVVELNLETLGQGGLIKIALDVKIGGIFYYIYDDMKRNKKTDKIEYIFGATLNQKAMDNASAYKQMQEIFDEVNKNIRKQLK